MKPGDYIKARFWLGETIWARVEAIKGGAVDAILDNHPANPEYKIGDHVSCGVDEVLDVIEQ